MLNYYLHVLSNYAAFSGRARRAEYWYFALVNFVIGVVLYLLGAAAHVAFLYVIYTLAVLIPSLAVTVRRLHDTGRSGWWWFIAFVPVVGAIVLLVFMVLEGTHGPNQYGPDPKAATAAVTA